VQGISHQRSLLDGGDFTTGEEARDTDKARIFRENAYEPLTSLCRCGTWRENSSTSPTKGICMPKEEWGVKRVCPSCATRFYDLRNDPMTCPSCGDAFDLESMTQTKSRTTQADKEDKSNPANTPAPDETEEVVLDDDEDVDVDLDDDLLDDDDDDDTASLEEIADVAKDDDES
jgi:uncharacterized protein (TIGR02300 family)